MNFHGIIVIVIDTANLVFGLCWVLFGGMVPLPSAGRSDEAVRNVDGLMLTVRMMAVVIAMTMMVEVMPMDFLMWRRRTVSHR